MKKFKSWFRLLPLLPVVFLFTGCYTYYASLYGQDWPVRSAMAYDYDGDVVEVPQVAVFLNPFMFTPCAPPVIYPVYDWYHRCWIPESEFHLWLRGPDVSIAFGWGLDWRFSVYSHDWYPVSRWHAAHPHYRGPRHYAAYDFGRPWRPWPNYWRDPHDGRHPDRGRWDEPRNGHGGFSDRDDRPHSNPGPGSDRDRPGTLHPQDRNRSFERQDPGRDRETAGTVSRTPPPASTGTRHQTVNRIVAGPVETGGKETTWNAEGDKNGTGSVHSGSQTRRVKRPERNQEPAANRNEPPKTMNRGNNTHSFQMPAFPDNRNRTSRAVRQAERPAAPAVPSPPRMKTGSSGSVEPARTRTEIRKRDSGERADRGVKTDSRESRNSGSRHSRR
ncbi:hypothetical protein JW777_00975 [bacterium]|nr:hypothetical protein [bacterium]